MRQSRQALFYFYLLFVSLVENSQNLRHLGLLAAPVLPVEHRHPRHAEQCGQPLLRQPGTHPRMSQWRKRRHPLTNAFLVSAFHMSSTLQSSIFASRGSGIDVVSANSSLVCAGCQSTTTPQAERQTSTICTSVASRTSHRGVRLTIMRASIRLTCNNASFSKAKPLSSLPARQPEGAVLSSVRCA